MRQITIRLPEGLLEEKADVAERVEANQLSYSARRQRGVESSPFAERLRRYLAATPGVDSDTGYWKYEYADDEVVREALES